MKVRFGIAAAVALAAVSVAAAQDAAATSAPRPRRQRLYDPSTVTTVTGRVESIQRNAGGRQGVHATLKSSDGQYEVLLGPAFYVDKQDTKIAVGDTVEVTGSKTSLASGPAIVAQSIKKGDQSLTLRGADGVPLWRAGRGGGRRGGGGPCAQNCGPGCPCQQAPGSGAATK